MMTHTFVTLNVGKKGPPSIHAKMILSPDMTETCKTRVVIKKFSKNLRMKLHV
jgi:hypothetical protein